MCKHENNINTFAQIKYLHIKYLHYTASFRNWL